MKITKMPGSLRLKYSAGTNAEGKEVFKNRTISNINPEATDEAVYALKALLAEVQEKPVLELFRVENKSIHQE